MANHFIEDGLGPVQFIQGGAARKDKVNPFYRAEMLANHFIEEGLGPVQFIQKAGAARNDVAKPVYRAELPADHFIEEGLEPVQFMGGFTRSGHFIEAFAVRRGSGRMGWSASIKWPDQHRF